MDITQMTRRLSNMSDGSIYDMIEDDEEFGETDAELSSGGETYGHDIGSTMKKKQGKRKDGKKSTERPRQRQGTLDRKGKDNPVAKLEEFEKMAGTSVNNVLFRQGTQYFNDSSDDEIPSEGEAEDGKAAENSNNPNTRSGGKASNEARGRPSKGKGKKKSKGKTKGKLKTSQGKGARKA